MRGLLAQFNAVPGSAGSVLRGEIAALPRLAFTYTRGHGFSAMPTPMRFPPGRRALEAFGAWARLAGHYQLAPGRDRRSNGDFEAHVFLAGVEVRVWVPIHGMTIQQAIDVVDAARSRVGRG